MYGPAKKWVVLACAAAILGIVTGSAHAARGGNGKKAASASKATSAISVESYSDLRLGGTVGFSTNAVGLAGWEWAMVDLTCEQNGEPVFAQLDKPDAAFLLGGGSSQWLDVGGAATCRADLDAYGNSAGTWSVRVLASTTFQAAG